MDQNMIVQLMLGPLFLVLAILFRLFPPRKINAIYGYRTPYSMKSQEVWDEANRFSSNLMIGVGSMVIIAQLVLPLLLPEPTNTLTIVSLLVVLLIATIPLTERHLRKHFLADGTPKSHR